MNYQELDLIILKNLITNRNNALDFVGECDSKLFAPEVWNAANVIISYIKNYKQVPTLNVLIDRLLKGNNDKLIDHIKSVWEQLNRLNIDEKEFKYNLEKLKKRFAEKQIITTKELLSKCEAGNIDVSKAVSDMQKSLQSIKGLDRNKSFEVKSLKDALPSFVEKFNIKKNNPKFESKIKTGYSFFDHATNGVGDSDFIVVAAESGFGKSILLQNFAIQIWLQDNKIDQKSNFTEGKNVDFFSLEMPFDNCFNRLLSRLSGVPSRKIENATLTKEEFQKIKCALDFIKLYPYEFRIIDIPDACANDLDKIIADSDRNDLCIFVDYLGIMRSNENNEDQDWEKQGKISYELRAICRKYRLPMFTAVQLNRKQSKDSQDNIGLHRLARSNTIATHATTVIQIESRQKEELHCDMIYHIIKNRNGIKGSGVLWKNLSCSLLLDKQFDAEEYQKNNILFGDISEELEVLEI